jgi:hypothetical protein
MTCLHLCSSRPELHSKGLMHVQQSIGILREPLEFGTIQVDVALATKLALGLAKSWEASRTSTGFEHLKEAKILLEKRYQVLENTEISLKRTGRLSFLANTWMYMDVIARLTTFGPDDCIDTKLITACNLLQKRTRDTKLDPLMGCASDCSVIGKAADLVRRIWKDCSKRNSPALVSQTAELMHAADTLNPLLDNTNDAEPASIVSDAVQTAEAYRWATILLLRQTIPALPGFLSMNS